MDQSGPEPQPSEKAEQPLHGAEAIAQYIFGDRKARRRVYYLAECSKAADLWVLRNLVSATLRLSALDRNARGSCRHARTDN